MAKFKIIELVPKEHYEIRIEAGKDPITGKRTRIKRRYWGRKRGAEQLCLDILSQLNLEEYRKPNKTPLSIYLQGWYDQHSKSLAPSTSATYKAIIDNHILPELGSVLLKNIRSEQINNYYSKKLATLKARSVQQHHSVLNKALDSAVRLKYIASNPCKEVDPPKPQGMVAKTLTVEQTVKLLKCFEGHPYRDIYITAAFTGMRLGEVLALRWEDVALPTVYVVQSLTRIKGENIFKKPKSGKARGMTVPHIVMEAINRQDKNGELVFSRADDTPFTPTVVSRHFIKTARANGFKIRFHDLRHSFATQLAAMGERPQVVQSMLGHHDVSFTLSRYTHAFDTARTVADRYNQILDGTKTAQNDSPEAREAHCTCSSGDRATDS